MAISSSCCLNLSPPPPTSSPSSLTAKTTQVAWPKKERSWRSQCVLGLTCIIIGLEIDNLTMGNESMAIDDQNMKPVLVVEPNQKGNRWSDKRRCPPWRENALETVVPENLPRPSAHRRWEAVGYTTVAPAVKVAVVRTSNGGCFTM
ncbi:hypothetical protein CsSME_00049115 [Camellia sinensis var. sinensis]|uniref:Uncharacterized protein n=1 Tax=Camellia sinensis var. sinensis TaxID=542762 RepID=A0A4S4D2L1_CAMSN|nr:uncharacterized protein LOC114300325 [Camellia sinensis]THF96510.1 hypothetical protein TEA_027780 [Camellia sinensis var. sinensis]